MFFYQALIMGAVVVSIYLLAFILKLKKRKVLVISSIALIIAGGVGLYAVQYYFGNHFYTQEIDTDTINGISFTPSQKQNLHKIFSDYSRVNKKSKTADAISKIYKVNGNGSKSTIDASIYVFSSSRDANYYFDANQKFYNKNYTLLDPLKCRKKGSGERYLVSFIESHYKDFTDFIYLPSKITYSSDLLIESDNVIVQISETANKPVTNKDIVINDIKRELKLKSK